MEASRRQPGMLEGLSRFLIQHERCGAGFDVAHPAGLGSGRVSITCRGCGARHEYATATIEFEREVKIEPMEPRRPPPPPRQPIPPPSGERPAIPPRPAPYPESAPGPTAPAPEEAAGAARASRPAPGGAAVRSGAPGIPGGPGAARTRIATPRRDSAPMAALRSFWRSPQATIALLVVAAVALGFGVVRLVNGGGGSESHTTAPSPSPPPAAAPAPTTAPSPVPGATAKPTPAPAPAGTRLLRTQRFTIEVPRDWTERTSTGGLLLQPRADRRVNVQIFFQRSPGLTLSQMADQTAAFLRREVPGASLFPRPVRIAGSPARELMARGPGETAIAVDVLHGPYRYLLVRRIFAGAKPLASVAAGRIVLSFRPR
jgi:hypothetical protein